MSRVIVGLSGGVDSSVAALLLKEQGHEVIGVFMKNWEETQDGTCTAVSDADDARAVCDVLGIPFYAVNFAKTYWNEVFAGFVRDAAAGFTPNPDVLCNACVKFGAFADYARKADAGFMATGHYARILREGGAIRLLRGVDAGKDQSYFLSGLTADQLSRAAFPIGGLEKRRVRELARDAGLPTAEKKDSTGICFIGERHFRAFLSRYVPMHPGDIVDTRGRLLGRHTGVAGYTLGQRHGLGIGGVGDGRPWFVAHKDVCQNRLVAVQGNDHPSLWGTALAGMRPSWIVTPPREGMPFACTAKIRYRQADQPCEVIPAEDGVIVRFKQPQRAITPGQIVVFYRGEECLGNAVIRRATEGGAAEFFPGGAAG